MTAEDHQMIVLALVTSWGAMALSLYALWRATSRKR